MHWPDPAQRASPIRDNLTARIAEAERQGWLGEVEGLKISLAGAEDKLAQIERRTPKQTTIHLGIPHSRKRSLTKAAPTSRRPSSTRSKFRECTTPQSAGTAPTATPTSPAPPTALTTSSPPSPAATPERNAPGPGDGGPGPRAIRCCRPPALPEAELDRMLVINVRAPYVLVTRPGTTDRRPRAEGPRADGPQSEDGGPRGGDDAPRAGDDTARRGGVTPEPNQRGAAQRRHAGVEAARRAGPVAV